jgi:hypothetical protein
LNQAARAAAATAIDDDAAWPTGRAVVVDEFSPDCMVIESFS